MSKIKRKRGALVGVLMVLALALGNGVFAQAVSREMARNVAETFFNQNARNSYGQLVHFDDITDETPFQNFYVFSADSGFVLVAADERATPILGYSKTSCFVTEEMPDNLRWWLDWYDNQIQYAIDNQLPPSEKDEKQWNDLKAGNRGEMQTRITVGPLTETLWGQKGYTNGNTGDRIDLYNQQCPDSVGVHCLPGCAAIALAQVMRYWQHPTYPHGTKTYTPQDPQHPEYYPRTVVFGNYSYDWSKMPIILKESTAQDTVDEVARFVYHCAVSIDSDFGIRETGASLSSIASALSEYFYYKPTLSLEQRSSYSDATWKQMLKDDLSASPGRPVCYQGTYYDENNNMHGHGWVCDGYEEVGENDYFHFNFGWYGASNQQGISYNNYYSIDPVQKYLSLQYIDNQAAIFGIEPADAEITATVIPYGSGMVTGMGIYQNGNSCTLTATSNSGFTFMGWYKDPMGALLLSRQPEYTFTVTGDRHLYAHFILANYTVMTSCSPTAGGNVAGGGTYMAGSTVTLTATANTGYVFSCWTEDGQVVSTQPTYSFTALSDRNLVANFVNLSFSLGTVITNPDGSKGVVFYINPTYTGGCMVALEDVSTGCSWGSSGDIPFVRNYTYTQNECLLSDLNGYANTEVLRNYQSANPNYASGKVDFGQGWYVPSAGQLRKLYGALPFIEVPMENAGGTTLSDNAYYWSSTESSESYAWTSAFEMSSSSKTSNYRLRAVHDFSINNTARVQLRTNNAELGTVAGTGFYANGATVTVTATPSGNNLFRGWTEAGHLVSQDPTYTFTANANRDLVANFAIRGGVGTLVNNPDGSQGVLFYLNDDGTEGWMVALEDASEGCQWGPSSDVTIMKDRALNDQTVLRDQEGFYNTWLIRISQGTDNGYAASVVDFDNGWYLPSSGQLRKLYAELPMIEEAIIKAGGSTLTDGKYWSSTEYSASYASTPGFEVSYTSKTTNCRVRAIRNYVPAGDHVVLVAANEDNMGIASVSGSGVFAQNQTVTVTATPNVGYQFDHWTEDGVTVSYDAEYQFSFTRSRSLVAHFVVPGTIGSVIHNLDGSIGVVFYVNDEGTEGLMVALEDASSGCNWGNNSDILVMPNEMFSGPFALRDNMGAENTSLLRICQGTGTSYAANTVDVDHGWFLPSSGQLRKLYAALPLIEEQLVFAGGSLLTTDSYWSSTEYSSSNAFSPMFEMTNSSKTTNHRVRAVRSFLTSGVHSLAVKANNISFGSVTGSGNYGYGATVTVTAVPNVGFAFDHWTEDGATVSYDATYQFTFTRNRSLVAHFVRPNSVGHIVTNADGSKGLVFYSDPSGNGSLIVALEDASSGCAWGDNQDVLSLTNQAPGYVQRMLEDMNGSGNSIALRTWQNNNPNYAVSQMDYANEWYLPSAGQLRKLYAALPLIEKAMVNAGGTLMSDNAYWSSSENSSNYAWSPSFEFTKTSKTSNLRVRAIRGINTPIGPSIITQTIALSAGWNWFSANVEITLNDLKSVLVDAVPGTSITIKSQTQNVKYQNGRWAGTLTALDMTQMYMISVTNDCEITLEGTPIDPSTLTVTINNGANWIAFPYNQSMTVTNFFGSFPVNNDQVKSQSQNARYQNNRWAGQLNTLVPGKGYMYISNTPGTRTFTFPASAK